MQKRLLFQKWTKTAGLLLMGGALAWAIKLSVIISTNGRIIDTGAAALFMKIGLVLLLIGSTGIGSWLSYHRTLLLRIIAIVISPALLFGILLLFGTFVSPLAKTIDVWYAQQEAPIALAVILCLAIGFLLYKSYLPLLPQKNHP
jgi:hypothetical protein